LPGFVLRFFVLVLVCFFGVTSAIDYCRGTALGSNSARALDEVISGIHKPSHGHPAAWLQQAASSSCHGSQPSFFLSI
jgi:hypothetical protein